MITETVEKEPKKDVVRSFVGTSAPVKTYTAFWPVLIVFLFFVITSILQLVSNFEAMNKVQATVAQLTPRVTQEQSQASAKNAALTGLIQDLVGLAPTSPIAQQIANDFRIPLKNIPARTSAPSSLAPPMAPAAPVNSLNGTVTPKQ